MAVSPLHRRGRRSGAGGGALSDARPRYRRDHRRSLPLRSFHQHIAALKQKLLHGAGVEALRGPPIDRYFAEAATIFCGLGPIWAVPARRMPKGIFSAMCGMSAPTRRTRTPGSIRPRHARPSHGFSRCRRLAMHPGSQEGGRSLLVSAHTIYNRMREMRPDFMLVRSDCDGSVRGDPGRRTSLHDHPGAQLACRLPHRLLSAAIYRQCPAVPGCHAADPGPCRGARPVRRAGR